MRMKEDMLNGQMKPAYNLQHGVDSNTSHAWISVHLPTDTRTLIPFLKDMELYLPFKYQEIVVMQDMKAKRITCFSKNGRMAYDRNLRTMKFPNPKIPSDIADGKQKYDEKADCYYCKMDRC